MSNDPESQQGYEEILADLKKFLEERFLPDEKEGLEPNSPLLQWGILTSLSTTELIAYIQDRYSLFIPPDKILGSNFKNLDVITKLVLSLKEESAALS